MEEQRKQYNKIYINYKSIDQKVIEENIIRNFRKFLEYDRIRRYFGPGCKHNL
jgi:hypothetical protein